MCTYNHCADASRIYGSRSQWLQHETESHRKVWRCHQHEDAIYNSPTRLAPHLKTVDRLSEKDVITLAEFSESSFVDDRPCCPICFARSHSFLRGIQNHLASHPERIAIFSLPRAIDSDVEASTCGSYTYNVRPGHSVDMSLTESLVFPHDDNRNYRTFATYAIVMMTIVRWRKLVPIRHSRTSLVLRVSSKGSTAESGREEHSDTDLEMQLLEARSTLARSI